ncbi:F-box protein [Tetrabaena socialis]|uniref:F-box protein n=1 Tax=Tetrabaena socialis TaxID=47790 RepID=A0A2J8ACU3_9CHLO|nr:F-box protein [Tetrabaena socialis]|eukprot:PNH10338.1 F-box protein [Tetrabaena socialis]
MRQRGTLARLGDAAVPSVRLTLFPHQRAAIRWMLSRERGRPSPPAPQQQQQHQPPPRERAGRHPAPPGHHHPSFGEGPSSPGNPGLAALAPAAAATAPLLDPTKLELAGGSGRGLAVWADVGSGELWVEAPPRLPEQQRVRGGFFCDEPGLGKTVTALSLVLKTLGQLPAPPPGAVVTWTRNRAGRRVGYYTPGAEGVGVAEAAGAAAADGGGGSPAAVAAGALGSPRTAERQPSARIRTRSAAAAGLGAAASPPPKMRSLAPPPSPAAAAPGGVVITVKVQPPQPPPSPLGPANGPAANGPAANGPAATGSAAMPPPLSLPPLSLVHGGGGGGAGGGAAVAAKVEPAASAGRCSCGGCGLLGPQRSPGGPSYGAARGGGGSGSGGGGSAGAMGGLPPGGCSQGEGGGPGAVWVAPRAVALGRMRFAGAADLEGALQPGRAPTPGAGGAGGAGEGTWAGGDRVGCASASAAAFLGCGAAAANDGDAMGGRTGGGGRKGQGRERTLAAAAAGGGGIVAGQGSEAGAGEAQQRSPGVGRKRARGDGAAAPRQRARGGRRGSGGRGQRGRRRGGRASDSGSTSDSGADTDTDTGHPESEPGSDSGVPAYGGRKSDWRASGLESGSETGSGSDGSGGDEEYDPRLGEGGRRSRRAGGGTPARRGGRAGGGASPGRRGGRAGEGGGRGRGRGGRGGGGSGGGGGGRDRDDSGGGGGAAGHTWAVCGQCSRSRMLPEGEPPCSEGNVSFLLATLRRLAEAALLPERDTALRWLAVQDPQRLAATSPGATVPVNIRATSPGYDAVFSALGLVNAGSTPGQRAVNGWAQRGGRGRGGSGDGGAAAQSPGRGGRRGGGGGGAASPRAGAHTWRAAHCMRSLVPDLQVGGEALTRALAEHAQPEAAQQAGPGHPPAGARHLYLSAATLVVLPATIIDHWLLQIRTHVAPGTLRACVLDRDPPPTLSELAWEYDIVITTFNRLSAAQPPNRASAVWRDAEPSGLTAALLKRLAGSLLAEPVQHKPPQDVPARVSIHTPPLHRRVKSAAASR